MLKGIFAQNRTLPAAANDDAASLLRGYELFNADDYLSANPDVKASLSQGIFSSALQHFQQHGNAERRFPGYAGFHWDDYIKANADLADFRNDADPEARAKQHFRESGYAEGRKIKP